MNDLVEVEGSRSADGFEFAAITVIAPSTGPSPDPSLDLDTLRARDRFLGAVRDWFRTNSFVEVETPILFRASGLNPHIAEFATTYAEGGTRIPLWLRTSPEVHHKRLLAAGLEKFYELGRFFRNGEVTDLHNPEFTGLELYEAWSDYRRIMEVTEAVLTAGIRAVGGTVADPPWERLTVREAMRVHAGIELPADDLVAMRAAAERLGIPTSPDDRFDDVFFRVFLEKVEPKLGRGRPTFLHDYPLSMGVMAKASETDPSVAERVELYIEGVELANGFTELNDAAEQRRRFEADRLECAARDGVPPGTFPIDEAFLAALAHGMPPSSGIAIGLDRVLMLALGRHRLQEVLPFPFRR